MNAHETALWLLDLGLWPIPITAPDDPHAMAPGKQPIGKGWGLERHTRESLAAVYAKHPGAGVGVKLGPEGGVIDIEVEDRELAAPALRRLFGASLPHTLGWESTRGPHLLFLWDERLARYEKAILKGELWPGVEFRLGWSSDGRQYQSVCPPSVGSDGTPREWNGHKKILHLPKGVFTELDRLFEKPGLGTIPAHLKLRPIAPWSTRERAIAYLRACPPAVSGERGHDKAFAVAANVGPGFDLDPSEAFRLLSEVYNPTCQPPWSEKELRHKVDDAYKKEERRGWLLKKDVKPVLDENGNEILPPEADDDPHRLARIYLSEMGIQGGHLTLRYWIGQWHRWDGSRYVVVSDEEIRSEITISVKTEFDRVALATGKPPKKVTTGLTNNTLQALKSLCLLRVKECATQPAWLGFCDEDLPEAKEVLPARNGLIHLPALIEGRKHLFAPTPAFFSPNALTFDFKLDSPEPTEWLKFLHSLWPDDQEAIDTLQEWFGYILTPDTSQQKILMIVGPKRSGKGTISRTLNALVGTQNTAFPTLSNMAVDFRVAPLIGKLVAIFADARLSGRADTQAIVERILSISGEDPQTLDRKHTESWNGTLTTRFILISNELPRLGDASGALPSRFVVLRLTQSFYGKEDTDLIRRILAELPSILLWSIAGWARLRARGYFEQPSSGQELVQELEDLSSPISAFISDCIEISKTGEADIPDVFKAWKAWCENAGRDHPGDAAGLGRQLRAAIPNIKTTQVRKPDGKRVRAFLGINLKPGGF